MKLHSHIQLAVYTGPIYPLCTAKTLVCRMQSVLKQHGPAVKCREVHSSQTQSGIFRIAVPSSGRVSPVHLQASDGTVSQGEPLLFVHHPFLQLDVGRDHKPLLALHSHLQDLVIQREHLAVLHLGGRH